MGQNVNCRHCDEYLFCQHPDVPPRRVLWIFRTRPACKLAGHAFAECPLQDGFTRPAGPPPTCRSNVEPPPPQRVVFEFDDRSLETLDRLIEQGHLKPPLTDVVVRDPDTGREHTVSIPRIV